VKLLLALAAVLMAVATIVYVRHGRPDDLPAGWSRPHATGLA